MSTEYFALGRCKTFELLSWPLLLWSRRIRSVVLYALFTPHELELVSLEKGKKRHLTEGMTEETLTDLTVLMPNQT